MDELRNIKMSSELKSRIKNEYKKEKAKPINRVRKFMNQEIEIDTKVLVAAIIVIVLIPTVDSIVKFKKLTGESISITSNEIGRDLDNEESKKE